MVLTKKEAYHPVVGLMPSPLEEVIIGNEWYREKWATPYMAAVARVVFGEKQPNSGSLWLASSKPYIELPQWKEEVPEERITALGAEAEWFKENRILVVVVIVALVLLFFFLKKGGR